MFALIGILVLSGGYYVLRGFANFVESGGTGILATPTNVALFELTHSSSDAINTLDFLNSTSATAKPARICQDFKVKVAKARIRQCPSETCDTVEFSDLGSIICVYGAAPDATDWYEINADPKDPVIEISYMHKSVLVPANPTSTPKPTLNLPTVTALPTNTAHPTLQSSVTSTSAR
jgi:hypothetical protein